MELDVAQMRRRANIKETLPVLPPMRRPTLRRRTEILVTSGPYRRFSGGIEALTSHHLSSVDR